MSSISVNRNGAIGELVLNNDKTLNALTHADIKALQQGLAAHQADPEVHAIVIHSKSERAFCAGGDMKQVRDYILAERFDDIHAFFTDEYALNKAIASCTKPYIALMHGIAMGGGLGISVHGDVRIVTETSVLAMPESRIGFFADVGASYFLPRLPQRAGWWLSLTAASVKGHEAVQVGLATHFVNSDKRGELLDSLNKALQALPAPSAELINTAMHEVLDQYTTQTPDNGFDHIMKKRQTWFADNNLDAIKKRLESSVQQGDEDAAHLQHLLDTGSPYSAQISLQLLADATGRTLEECLALELALGEQAVRYPDCAEGVRAVLVDKDRKPAWQPL